MTASLSVLVLTEDSAATATAVVARIVSVTPTARDAPAIPEDAFASAPEQAMQSMRGNVWKSAQQKDHQRRVALTRFIANKLAESVRSYVVFHFDGDRPWRERKKPGDTEVKFEGLRNQIHQQLVAAWSQPRRNGESRGEDVEAALARLVCLVPFYSIEAWLYQSTEVAIRLCRQHHRGRDIETFEAWRNARHTLDDVDKVAEQVCLGKDHNLELAQGFPAREVEDAGTSFHAFCNAAERSGLIGARS